MVVLQVEMTEVLNFTQYESSVAESSLPSPLPFPYSLSAVDTKAPGWISTCIRCAVVGRGKKGPPALPRTSIVKALRSAQHSARACRA